MYVLAGGVAVQFAIGGVYAWSVFSRALTSPDAMGITKVQAAIPFELAIAMIFVGAFLGGRLQDRSGPRAVALSGVIIYSAGVLLSSLVTTADQLWLLILSYGIIGGFGLGMAYIVPVAVLQKWFPDKAAVATGAAIAGFGFGAVVTAPVAQFLIGRNPEHPTSAFLVLGVGYLVVGTLGASVLVNPAVTSAVKQTSEPSFTVGEALRMPQWYLLTATLALGVTAGISLISVAAVTSQDIAGFSITSAATAVGLLGLFNGAGRLLWPAIGLRMGKTRALAAILIILGVALLILPLATAPVPFVVLAAIIYTCYGGVFGTLPATSGEYFGLRHSGAIYGLMLMGWGIGGICGPLLATALLGDGQNYVLAFSVVGGVAILGSALPLLARKPQLPSAE